MRKEDREIAVVVFFALLLFSVLGFMVGHNMERPKVGGDEVPHGLTCEEDEVIGYDPLDMSGPRPLTCVHVDNFVGAAK